MLTDNDFKLDFVGIGAAKAGTSWLAICLGEHPQIYIPPLKELQYFPTIDFRQNKEFYAGRDKAWLQAQFSCRQPGQLRGDFTTTYLYHPPTPRLIKQEFPEAKIIVSYRHPVDRLYSVYYHHRREFAVPDTFEAYLEKYPHMLQTSFYYRYTQNYLDYFTRENIHFILFDDILATPQDVLINLFKFLKVEPDYCPPNLFKKVNSAQLPRSNLLRNFIGYSRDWLNSKPALGELKKWLIRLGFEAMANRIYAFNLRPFTPPAMRPETRSRLLEVYAEENALLASLLNRDLSHWQK